MHRPTIGIIALLLLAGAAYFWLNPPPRDDTVLVPLQAATHRLFLVMGALWLAQPQLRHMPRWVIVLAALAGVVVLGAILFKQPRALLLVVPILIALWITRTWHQVDRRQRDAQC
jgi:hypothetical protein